MENIWIPLAPQLPPNRWIVIDVVSLFGTLGGVTSTFEARIIPQVQLSHRCRNSTVYGGSRIPKGKPSGRQREVFINKSNGDLQASDVPSSNQK